MKNIPLILLAFICIITSCSDVKQSEIADTIYTNGKIYTVNEAQPWAEAVAIINGKFQKVGTNDEILALKGAETEIIDLEGKFVMPGMIDVHTQRLLQNDPK